MLNDDARERKQQRFFEHWVDSNISKVGMGFYAKDAYVRYSLWMEEEGLRPIMGRNKFAWGLEALGYRRTVRRGMAFFEDGTLKGSKKRINIKYSDEGR